MKIIYLHQYFNTPEMSGGTRSYEMARRMVSAGHQVHIITSQRELSSKKKGWLQTEESGIHVHWYPVPYSNSMGFSQRIIAFLSFALAARRKAVGLGGDIIFATSTPLTIALPAVLSSHKRKIPMVFEVRDLWPEMPIAIGALNNPVLRFAAYRLERWAYKNSSAVIALSPGMKEGVVRTGYPAENVAVIPNSCDNKEFKHDEAAAKKFRADRPQIGDRPLLVYSGTFGKVNDVGYMVKLAEELLSRKSDICILLVGDGAERNHVYELAMGAGVYGKNLFIEDPLPKKDMPSLLSSSTMASNLVIDLAEARANSANKFFDTLAAGKPVFLNHGGWMHDLVEKHQCGLALWRCPIVEVATELDEKMHNQRWLEQAGLSAKQLAQKYFDRDLLAEQLMAVLEAVNAGHSSRASSISPGLYD